MIMKNKYRIVARTLYYEDGKVSQKWYYAQVRKFLFFWMDCKDVDDAFGSFDSDYDVVDNWVQRRIKCELESIEFRKSQKHRSKNQVIKTY